MECIPLISESLHHTVKSSSSSVASLSYADEVTPYYVLHGKPHLSHPTVVDCQWFLSYTLVVTTIYCTLHRHIVFILVRVSVVTTPCCNHPD